MVFNRDITLFLYLLVGSVGMGLYAGWSSNSWAFLIYSSLFITTMDTLLSAVRMILFLSLLSSASAFCSSLVMFNLGGCIFFRMDLISPLSSSASPCFSCEHACSIKAMYSPTGGHLGTTAKFGPCNKTFNCASISEVLEMFLTHILLLLVLVLIWESEVLFVPISSWSPCWVFEQLPLIFLLLWHNLWNFDFWHSKVMKCLDSFFSLMKPMHSFTLSLSSVFSKWFLHVSTWILSMLMVLLINLILSFRRAFSAFLIIWWPLGVLMLLLSLVHKMNWPVAIPSATLVITPTNYQSPTCSGSSICHLAITSAIFKYCKESGYSICHLTITSATFKCCNMQSSCLPPATYKNGNNICCLDKIEAITSASVVYNLL